MLAALLCNLREPDSGGWPIPRRKKKAKEVEAKQDEPADIVAGIVEVKPEPKRSTITLRRLRDIEQRIEDESVIALMALL